MISTTRLKRPLHGITRQNIHNSYRDMPVQYWNDRNHFFAKILTHVATDQSVCYHSEVEFCK